MTNERAKSELMQLYGSLSEEKKQALDVLMAQADGEYISRQAVLKTLDDMDNVLDEDRTIENYKELLKECYEVLPSVNPQEKTGHWIYKTMEGQFCSICGEQSVWKFNYCPNCGAKMVEEQERSE